MKPSRLRVLEALHKSKGWVSRDSIAAETEVAPVGVSLAVDHINNHSATEVDIKTIDGSVHYHVTMNGHRRNY